MLLIFVAIGQAKIRKNPVNHMSIYIELEWKKTLVKWALNLKDFILKLYPLMYICSDYIYRQFSNIRCTQIPKHKCFSSCICLCPIHWSQMLSWEWNVVGAVLTGDAPTTSEWSTILLPTKVHLILETLHITIFSRPRFILLYGIIGPQLVNDLFHWCFYQS